jgi:hypothetical protein
MKSIYPPGPLKVGEVPQDSQTTPIYEILSDENGLLSQSIIYADSTSRWLGGVEDNQIPGDPRNWIRSGTYLGDLSGASDFNMPTKAYDPNEVYEKIANGTWGPYLLTAATEQDDNGPAYSLNSKQFSDMTDLASVNIVLTNDPDKWTRSLVVEMCSEYALSEGNVNRFKIRAAQSVDKNGNPAPAGSGISDNPNDPNYISETGMGWFPGYAINLETGERLNIMFGEDSWLSADNGRDMLFNPTSTVFDEVTGRARFGGKHYIYVMDHTLRPIADKVYEFPAYDACKYIRYGYDLYPEIPSSLYEIQWYSSTMYVGIPLAIPGQEFLNNEVTIKIRIAKPYQQYYSLPADSATNAESVNNNLPMYRFETASVATAYEDPAKMKSDLDLIRVVPNPYYAYAGGEGYERNALDNRVKITNLPTTCVITIYNVSGTLIRQYTKDEPVSYLDWDLKNFAGVPIAGGVYIIHVKTDVGERILKWFGGMRQPDYNVF